MPGGLLNIFPFREITNESNDFLIKNIITNHLRYKLLYKQPYDNNKMKNICCPGSSENIKNAYVVCNTCEYCYDIDYVIKDDHRKCLMCKNYFCKNNFSDNIDVGILNNDILLFLKNKHYILKIFGFYNTDRTGIKNNIFYYRKNDVTFDSIKDVGNLVTAVE